MAGASLLFAVVFEIRCKSTAYFCEKACKMPCLLGKLCYRARDGGNIYFQHVGG